MAHEQQHRFIALVHELLIPKGALRVLDIGAYDVNGSNRKIFAVATYTGADLCTGPGVDIVASGHELTFPDASFDVALSTECFEHNPYWQQTFHNMHRMAAADGVVIVTCAGRGRLEHGTSRTTPGSSPGTQSIGSEYYRNLIPRDFARMGLGNLFRAWHLCAIGTDTYFIGWKGAPPALDEFKRRLPAIRVHDSWPVRLYYLPLRILAFVIPEGQFQNLALIYMKGTAALRKAGGKLTHLKDG